MLALYDFQNVVYSGQRDAFNIGFQYVLCCAPTGGGKTVIFSRTLFDHKGPACAIAHRQELVSQISLALSKYGVMHRIIGPHDVIKLCVNLQMQEFGRSFYNPSADVAVAGVDTLIRRGDSLREWLNSVTLWVIDEAHHVLRENKWGQAAGMFPNARGVGFTATPTRSDGKGLGAHTDGIFEYMVSGPCGRELISRGFLTDYRIFAPPSDVDVSEVPISQVTGDYAPIPLVKAVRKSHIVGDVVAHYLRIAAGKLGVTFATDIQTATDISDQYNSQGVPAAIISANTTISDRVKLIRQFRTGKLLQLVNVDIFGEGFDLPAIQVVSMARPTASFGLYSQQFGRALRVMVAPEIQKQWHKFTDAQRLQGIAESIKPRALLLDHVHNVEAHGLPDASRQWSLDRRDRKRSAQDKPVRTLKTCTQCTGVYERILDACPYCGAEYAPAQRSTPEQVDGNLLELDPETLARMRGEVDAIDKPADAYRAELVASHCPQIGVLANVKRHLADQTAQATLRESIAWWGGYQRAQGRTDSESYRKFYIDFGIDVLTAKALHADDAGNLNKRVKDAYTIS